MHSPTSFPRSQVPPGTAVLARILLENNKVIRLFLCCWFFLLRSKNKNKVCSGECFKSFRCPKENLNLIFSTLIATIQSKYLTLLTYSLSCFSRTSFFFAFFASSWCSTLFKGMTSTGVISFLRFPCLLSPFLLSCPNKKSQTGRLALTQFRCKRTEEKIII